ncbi:MAG TPA: Rpn family recombination-promoting nuclease/putative transposase [Thermoanaerobaculia bacterium]|nr:Rpn family recombination-promoting nuclease/putative transposase [Thermoanaerobaculia bacterium]
MGQHDRRCQLFFSHVSMVCDFLREIIGEDWMELIDFASAERVNASFVSEKRRNRESDIIWKLRRRDTSDWVYAFVLLELPSRPDHYMPVRLMTFKDTHYDALLAEGLLAVEPDVPWRELVQEPMYGGKGFRKKESSLVADLFSLEPSRSWEAARVGVARLQEHVGREEPRVRYAYQNWLEEVILPRMGEDAYEIPKHLTLEEFESIIDERIAFWTEQLREESWQQDLQEGLQQGRQEGEAKALLRLLEKRFGPVDQGTRDRIVKADADLLLEWFDRFPTAESLTDVFRS